MKRVQLQMKIMQMQVTEPNRREDQGGKVSSENVVLGPCGAI